MQCVKCLELLLILCYYKITTKATTILKNRGEKMNEKMNVKEKIKKHGLNQWEIAEKINVSEFTFSRWMRRPENLSQEKILKINKALEELTEEGR